MGTFSLYRDSSAHFEHNIIIEFDKNANFIYDDIVVNPFSRKVSLATIGVCVFCAVYFGSRTFLILKDFTDMGEKTSNYSQTTSQDTENVNEEDFTDGTSNENYELFKRALSEAVAAKISSIEKEVENMDLPPPTRRHKIRMNRLFRERIGSSFLPFPEVDNLYERVRSRVVIKLKINEFLDRRKNGGL